MKSITSGLGGAVARTLKWGVTLLGIGTAFGAIRKGVSSYLNSNEQLKANLDYMTFAIGQALAPAVQFVVNLMMNLLGIVGAIAQVFFGVNLFANSVSSYMASANKSSAGMKKNLGSLAGFDEINNVGGKDSSSGGTTVKMPNFNLNDKVNEWTNKIGPQLKIVKAVFEDLWYYLKLGAGAFWVGLQAVFFIGSSTIAGIMEGLAEVLASVIVSVIDIIVGLFKGLWQIVSGLIQGIVQIIVSAGRGIWQIISGVFTNIFNMVKGVFSGIIQFIVGIFTGNFKGAIQGLVTIFSSIWNGLKGIVSSVFGGIWTIITGAFNEIATFIRGAVDGLITILTSLVKGVCNIFIGIFNGVIKVINGFIRGINMIKIPDWVPIFGGRGFNIKQLGTINYFANGGVLTKPTLGIMGEYANARSNPEIVTPQNIMYQTLSNAIRDNNYSSNNSNNSNQPINLIVKFADRTIFEEFIDYANSKSRRNGVSVFAEV